MSRFPMRVGSSFISRGVFLPTSFAGAATLVSFVSPANATGAERAARSASAAARRKDFTAIGLLRKGRHDPRAPTTPLPLLLSESFDIEVYHRLQTLPVQQDTCKRASAGFLACSRPPAILYWPRYFESFGL